MKALLLTVRRCPQIYKMPTFGGGWSMTLILTVQTTKMQGRLFLRQVNIYEIYGYPTSEVVGFWKQRRD